MADKQIILVDRSSIRIELKAFNFSLKTQRFEQSKIYNFQVSHLLHDEIEDFGKIISDSVKITSEAVYALSFRYPEEEIAFAQYLAEQDITQIIQWIQSYLPDLRHQWEVEGDKFYFLIQTLTEFALLSRYRKEPFNQLLQLSNIPSEVLKTVLQDNPWLSVHLNALTSGTKAVNSPSLDEVPHIYAKYLESTWERVAEAEATVWDVMRRGISQPPSRHLP